MLLAASFVVTYHMGKQKVQRRKGRAYSAHRSNTRSPVRVEELPLSLASVSLCLAALRIVLTTHGSLSSSFAIGDELALVLRRVHCIDRIIGVLEELPLRSEYLYAASLWMVLLSTFLALASAVWSVLDPRSDAGAMKTLRSLGVHGTAVNGAAVTSIGVLLGLAYMDLPLVHKSIDGEIQIDFGLPHALIQALQQILLSFVGFCIFNKLLPRETPESNPAAGGTKRTKKYIMDPAIVKRMSALAREASERVEARKNNSLRRTHSIADFRNASTPPPSRRRSLRSSLTMPRQQPPPSPLRDIHLAGRTLSSTDLLAKLRDNGCIKRSVSSGCLQVPESIITLDMPDLLPNLAEEEKVHDDESVSTPSPPESTEDLAKLARSNPQSSHTPVPMEF